MKAPERGARLTISASAAREFFDPERTKGLRLRVADDTIELKASGTRSGADVIPVEFRTRGGLAATIDPGGTHASDLFRSLRRAGYSDNAPFFVLTESSRGWVGLDHHRSRHPPLNKPHMRLWMSSGAGGRGGARQREEPAERPKRKQRTQVERRPAQKRGDGRRRRPAQSEIDWGQFGRSILKAKKLMDRPPPVRRRQDSEMALERAKDDLEQFRRLAEEVLGVMQDSPDTHHLQAEHDSAVSEIGSLRDEVTVLREEIANLRGSLEEAQEQRAVAEEALRNINRQSQRAEDALHPGQRRRGGRRIRMPEPISHGDRELDEGIEGVETQEPAAEAAALPEAEPESEHDVHETEEGHHEDREAADHEPEREAEGEQDEQPPTEREQDEQPPTEEVEFPPKEEC